MGTYAYIILPRCFAPPPPKGELNIVAKIKIPESGRWELLRIIIFRKRFYEILHWGGKMQRVVQILPPERPFLDCARYART